MGMTDRQFDEYQASLLRDLRRIEKEVAKAGLKIEDLDRLISDIENGLQRP